MPSILSCTAVLVANNKAQAQAKLADQSLDMRFLDSGLLFASGSEVVITHGAEIYRLRLTRQNKLILTK